MTKKRTIKDGRKPIGYGLSGKALEKELYANKKTERIVLLVTKKEKELIKKGYLEAKKSINISQNQYLVNLILGKDISKIIYENTKNNLIKEINRVGVNLNQAVKKINSFKKNNVVVSYELKKLVSKIKELEEYILKIIN